MTPLQRELMHACFEEQNLHAWTCADLLVRGMPELAMEEAWKARQANELWLLAVGI